MNRYKVLLENERQILTSVSRLIHEGKRLTDAEKAEREAEKVIKKAEKEAEKARIKAEKEVEKANRLTAKESEPFVIDMWNTALKGGDVPKNYANRGLEPLFNAIKPHAKSPVTRIGDKSYALSDFWKDVTGKAVDTSKTDVKGDKNYSVKYGPARLMGGVPDEARATFLAAAEKSGLAEKSEKIAIGFLEELKEHAFNTIGVKMNITALRNYKSEDELTNSVNKEAYSNLTKGEELQKKLLEEMQKLFNNNPKFQQEFIYEAMTGAMKFSDTEAIADTMLCINKNGQDIKIESVIDSSSPYVQKVINATNIKVMYRGHTKDDESGMHYNTVLDLAVKDLTEAITEHLFAVNKYKSDSLNENFLDFVKKTWKKLKAAFEKMKEFILKAIEYIKAGFMKLLEFFGMEVDVQGWQKLDTIDLSDVA